MTVEQSCSNTSLFDFNNTRSTFGETSRSCSIQGREEYIDSTPRLIGENDAKLDNALSAKEDMPTKSIQRMQEENHQEDQHRKM